MLSIFAAAATSLVPGGAAAARPPRLRARGGRLCSPPPGAQPEPPASQQPATAEGEAPRYSSNWSGAGRFSDDEPLPLWFWLLGPRPRRALLPALGATLIAPAVNLWGSGSFLLSLAPEAARARRLDTFYPISDQRFYPYSAGGLDYGPGFQRYVDPASRFEFRYPANYVQDQAVFLRNADRAYAQRTMDPALAAARGGAAARAPPRGSGPDVAFGPPGQAGEENLSVVIGSLVAGFSLRGTLGPPAEAAERLLQSSIAKPGVRETTLLGSFERASAQTGLPLYQFEYKVEYPSLNKAPTYTVCVVGAKRDNLFTFASRVPAAEWEARPEVYREAASSFELL